MNKMHPVRKQRLVTVIFIVLASSVAVGLLVYALRDNMNLFYPPSKIVAGAAPTGKTIRAGGCVVPGTVKNAEDSLQVFFDVTDGMASLPVTYTGILPDLFAEGEAAVLTGKLDTNGLFVASQVLAKHDESYMPAEVADAMQGYGDAGPEGAQHAATCEGLSYGS